MRGRARELGIDLAVRAGHGPGGRITQADLDAYVAGAVPPQPGAAAPRPAAAQRDGVEEIRVIGVRRKIAENMQEAKRRIPHFSYTEEIDMSELESLRAHLNEKYGAERPRLTLLPFLDQGAGVRAARVSANQRALRR